MGTHLDVASWQMTEPTMEPRQGPNLVAGLANRAEEDAEATDSEAGNSKREA